MKTQNICKKNHTKTFEEACNQEYLVRKIYDGAGYSLGMARFPRCLIGCKIKIKVVKKSNIEIEIRKPLLLHTD
jgi:hypothetical protein